MLTARQPIGPYAISLSAHGPLGEIHLRLEDHFNAIYGKNGAGKTWLLRSAHQALSGIESKHASWVHYRINDDLLDDVDPYSDPVQSALLEGLAAGAYGPNLEAIILPEEDRTPKAPLRGAIGRVLLQWLDLEKEKPFFREILASGLLSLKPIGHGEPRWQVYAAMSPTTDTPAFNSLLEYRKYRQARDVKSDETLQQIRDLNESGNEERATELLRELLANPDSSDEWAERMVELGVSVKAWRILDQTLDELPGLLERYLPIPLLPICDLTLTHGFSIFVNETDPEMESRTLKALLASSRSIVEAMNDTEVILTSEARKDVEELSKNASANVRTALGAGAPDLRCRIPDWKSGQALVWEASTDDGETWIRFDGLGSGHRRWVTAATQLAVLEFEANTIGKLGTGWEPFWQRIILMDEPEAGLHPIAQRAAFEGLSSYSQQFTILTATHSAIPFGLPQVRLWYLHANDVAQSVLSATDNWVGELLAGNSAAVAALGLDSASALQIPAIFLLVEGEHDVVVVRTLLPDDLRDLRVACLAIRGTKALGAASVEMFMQFSDATVCFALDNNAHNLVERCWSSALEHIRKGDKGRARHALEPIKKSGTDEQMFLYGVCLQAIKMGHYERLRVTGWDVPDVIYLLPVAKFLSGFQSWHDVEILRQSGESIKDTIWRLRDKPVGVVEIQEIAQDMDSTPPELLRLRDSLHNLGEPEPSSLTS
ncbi:MAG: hypothetical protein ACP5PJ_08630 [Acidimicrobiales bacterium]